MSDLDLIRKTLSHLQAAALRGAEGDVCPHPLDPVIDQMIEAWTHLSDVEREQITANLTPKQRTHLFQFTHRIPLRAKGLRNRVDKLALVRMVILANTMEGFSQYTKNEISSNFMSIDLALDIARPWPIRTLTPLWEEATKLAAPKPRHWLLTRYAGKDLKEKFDSEPTE